MSTSITRPPRNLKKLKRGGFRHHQSRRVSMPREPRSGQNPFVLAILGVLLLAAWLGCSLFEIQTTEAWILQGNPPGIANVAWGVLYQFGQLASGNMSGSVGKAMVVGWAVEIITLIFGCALEVAAHGVGRSSPELKGLFLFAGFALMAFDGYTNYNYGSLPSGQCGQLFFAGVMAFLVVFGLPASIEMLLRAKDEFTR